VRQGDAEDEYLEETEERLLVEPRDRDRLDAPLEGLRVEPEPGVEVLELVGVPVEVDILAADLPLVELALDLDPCERGALLPLLASFGVALGAPRATSCCVRSMYVSTK
jgi:hypothetical protein